MEKVQFVNFLSKKEIRAFLALIGYRELNETDGEQFKKGSITRLNKLKDDDSKILVMCKPINEEERQNIFRSFSSEISKEASKILAPLFLSMVALGGYSYYNNDNIKFLMLENYCVYESLSLVIDEEKYQEYFNRFTKAYVSFMKIKFGKFYNEQRKKYIKKVIKENENEQQVNNSANNIEEEKID